MSAPDIAGRLRHRAKVALQDEPLLTEAAAALDAQAAEIERLRAALEFYATGFITHSQEHVDGYGSECSWNEPTAAMTDDAGAKARAALEGAGGKS